MQLASTQTRNGRMTLFPAFFPHPTPISLHLSPIFSPNIIIFALVYLSHKT